MKIFFIFLMQSNLLSAQNRCWKNEEDYKTKKVYAAEKLYQEDLNYWTTFNKENPDPLMLSKAYIVYKSEIIKTNKFKKDKVKHCYMGCRIAAETNISTTKYIGWKKEYDDLTDCKLSSHFEILDYQATVDGANHAGNGTKCEYYCVTHW